MGHDFEPGQYVIYKGGNGYELGRVHSVESDGAFVAYHSGETCAKTSYDKLHPIINDYCIMDTSLGASRFTDTDVNEISIDEARVMVTRYMIGNSIYSVNMLPKIIKSLYIVAEDTISKFNKYIVQDVNGRDNEVSDETDR